MRAARADAVEFAAKGRMLTSRATLLTPRTRPVPCALVRLAVLVCVLAVLGGAACDQGRRLRARKENLLTLPLPWRRPSINVADDGAHVTFSVRARGGYYVVTPHGRARTFEDVTSPLFAPKSDRVLYWGSHTEEGRKRYDVGVDTTVVPTAIVEPIELIAAPGGARWAALGFVDVDAEAAPDAPRPMVLMVDGREMGRYAEASRPSFSPDGAHVAWAIRDPSGTVTIIVDGTVIKTIEAVPPVADGPRLQKVAVIRYLADGRLLALVPDGDGWSMFRGDERLATYGYALIPGTFLLGSPETKGTVVPASLVTASEAPVAVWWERMPGATEQWRVVRDGGPIDGMTCDRHWETQPPVVSNDGAHVAYVCPTPAELGAPLGHRWVTLDGRRFGMYVETWKLGLSDDGTQVAYAAADTLPIMAWRIFVNGMPRTPPEVLVWRPRFSADGAHLFWAGGPERGRRNIAIDGRTITRFDDVLYGPEFPRPRTALWVIRRGRKISRVEATY